MEEVEEKKHSIKYHQKKRRDTMSYNHWVEMKKNADQFWENKQELEKKIENLQKVLREEKLPENLLDPQNSHDSTEVTWFADKIYELGCDISELGENFMVGELVSQAWDEKSGYTSYREKLQDLGHKESDF